MLIPCDYGHSRLLSCGVHNRFDPTRLGIWSSRDLTSTTLFSRLMWPPCHVSSRWQLGNVTLTLMPWPRQISESSQDFLLYFRNLTPFRTIDWGRLPAGQTGIEFARGRRVKAWSLYRRMQRGDEQS